MFEQEYRSQQQISREAAERFAIMVAITTRRAEAKRVRHNGVALQCGLNL